VTLKSQGIVEAMSVFASQITGKRELVAPLLTARFAGMFHPVASDMTMAEAKRSRISAFGIEYEGKSGLSTSEFSWAA